MTITYLVELGKMLLANKPPLSEILMTDADFILEVGLRALEKASTSPQFTHKTRLNIPAQSRPIAQAPHIEFSDFDDVPSALPAEGTVFFLINHPHENWAYGVIDVYLGYIHIPDYGVILFDKKKRTLHDFVAGSFVITKKSYKHINLLKAS